MHNNRERGILGVALSKKPKTNKQQSNTQDISKMLEGAVSAIYTKYQDWIGANQYPPNFAGEYVVSPPSPVGKKILLSPVIQEVISSPDDSPRGGPEVYSGYGAEVSESSEPAAINGTAPTLGLSK